MKSTETLVLAYQMNVIDLKSDFQPSVKSSTMEDSLFPFISDSYNDFVMSDCGNIPRRGRGLKTLPTEEHSDMEEDSMPESQMDLTEVDVYTKLEHKERDLILAAELGKSLLEKNEQLTQENEQLQQGYQESLEALEQEKHELRRRLEFKTNEYEANSVQFNNDLMRTQEELKERKAMLLVVEREKSRAVEELSEQNHKLLNQLHLASAAEKQLSAQVQQLRKEFLERSSASTVRILQLESLKEQIEQGSETRAQLETNFDAMKDETVELRDALSGANERVHNLERQLHDRERELKRVMVELNDAHVLNTQLQVRVDEMREEISLQMSFASTGNSSLFAELEQSGIDCSGMLDHTPLTAPNSNAETEEGSEALFLPTESDLESKKVVFLEDMTSEMTLQCYQALLSGISNCHHQVFELKQELWEVYQRIQSTCTVLRSYIKNKQPDENNHSAKGEISNEQNNAPHSPGAINLSKVLDDLSSLVHETLETKETQGGSNDIHEMLKEKQTRLMLERDEAVAAKNHLEVDLVQAKVDLMSVNSQLLEAIQQKLQQQKELEAWQDDMEQMIQKALNERNAQNKISRLRRMQETNQQPSPQQKSSWFSFSRRSQNSPAGDSSTSNNTDPNKTSPVLLSVNASPPISTNSTDPNQARPSRFSAWLKRRQNPDPDQPIADTSAPK